jgi:hypothetical protein
MTPNPQPIGDPLVSTLARTLAARGLFVLVVFLVVAGVFALSLDLLVAFLAGVAVAAIMVLDDRRIRRARRRSVTA